MTSASRPRIAWWPWALVASAVTFVLGGLLHPDEPPGVPEAEGLAAWIGSPLWVPSHTLILTGSILLVPGLIGLLAGRPDLTAGARRAGRVALVGAVVWVVESVPHLGAAAESAAAAAGDPTPILFSHMVLSLLAYPLVGLAVAALAVLGGRTLTHPVFAALAVVGGVAWSLAPWLVGPLAVEGADVLFPLGILMATWFAAVGVSEAIRRRSAAPEPTPA
jgi:hypothetical protein